MAIMIKAISTISLLALQVLAYTHLVKYNFGSNFGQVFYDYSGNGNHGQNGDSLSSDSFDTVPTDRGAYSDGSKYIKLPPNSKVSSSVNIGTVYSITLWYLPISDNGFYITHRSWGSYFFFIIKYGGHSYISVRMQTPNYWPGEQSGGTLSNSKL